MLGKYFFSIHILSTFSFKLPVSMMGLGGQVVFGLDIFIHIY